MSELVDLVDKTGKVQERSVPRATAEQTDGLYLPIVVAVVFNGLGQILVHERAAVKDVAPGLVDHVCGGIQTRETPEQAALREAEEETGTKPAGLRVIDRGINEYGRYRYLLVGSYDGQPGINLDPQETAWAAFYDPEELCAARQQGTLQFVDGFFEDLDRALG